jgi:hypothetical protein
MTKTIATFAATITLAASLLTGCTADFEPEVATDDAGCLDDSCLDAQDVAPVDAGASAQRPEIGDMALTTIYADLFQGDWPIEEIVVEAYEGELSDEDRELIERLLTEAVLNSTEHALASLAQRIDDGAPLTAKEIRVIEKLQGELDQLDELIQQK